MISLLSETNDEINQLLDQEVSMVLVNSSGWSPMKVVNKTTKNELVQGLLFNEVIYKREKQLQAFRKGLDRLGFLQLLKMNPVLRYLLVHEETPMTSSMFLSLIAKDETVQASLAYNLFVNYVESRQEAQEQVTGIFLFITTSLLFTVRVYYKKCLKFVYFIADNNIMC